MSPRTYLRRFARDVGTSPIKWLIARRVQASLPLLEATEAPIERIATAVGFDSAITYRHHFARAMATSPSEYRRTFRRAPDGELGEREHAVLPVDGGRAVRGPDPEEATTRPAAVTSRAGATVRP
jgi:AraC family transcriptional activator FtrA